MDLFGEGCGLIVHLYMALKIIVLVLIKQFAVAVGGMFLPGLAGRGLRRVKSEISPKSESRTELLQHLVHSLLHSRTSTLVIHEALDQFYRTM